MRVAVLGAGIQGVCAALELAARGCSVDLYEREAAAMSKASRWNEGKIHLGFIFANDLAARSARKMALGSLHFWEALRRWIDVEDLIRSLSEPFHYVVHRDSMVSSRAIEAHFTEVAAEFDALREALGLSYLGEEPGSLFEGVPREEFERHYNASAVRAVFRTAERSIDAHALADRLVVAVSAEPRIAFLGGHVVDRVDRERNGSLSVLARSERSGERYAHVVNALWSERLRVDAALGIEPSKPWLFRRKLAIHLDQAGGEAIPSTTIVLGPFGDVVGFAAGRMYLSWYPACRIASSAELEPGWHDPIDESRKRTVRERTVEGLATVIPSVAGVNLNGNVNVEGGAIFTWGTSDITDIESELHQRFDIGVHSYGNYHSVDTGKYCMAPYFALELARRIRPPG